MHILALIQTSLQLFTCSLLKHSTLSVDFSQLFTYSLLKHSTLSMDFSQLFTYSLLKHSTLSVRLLFNSAMKSCNIERFSLTLSFSSVPLEIRGNIPLVILRSLSLLIFIRRVSLIALHRSRQFSTSSSTGSAR